MAIVIIIDIFPKKTIRIEFKKLNYKKNTILDSIRYMKKLCWTRKKNT